MEQRQRDLLFAGELAEDVGWTHLERGGVVFKKLLAELAQELVEVVEGTTLPLKDRVQAGVYLSRLGDPRVPITSEEWRGIIKTLKQERDKPRSYFRLIPSGKYLVGHWNTNQGSRIQIQAFYIARYPITVAQFKSFLADNGYTEPRWWTNAGWKWKTEQLRTRPETWQQPGYDSDNQPVTGVSWYEACAFTTWLDAKIYPEGHSKAEVRLPTEAEWEVAAACNPKNSEQRYCYPWGNSGPSPEHAIFDESDLTNPAPIGICSRGQSPCGALDMLGNVWEWTTSSFQGYPEKSNEKLADFSSHDVPARGGAWFRSAAEINCSLREENSPAGERFVSHGFRVVLAFR
jgi:formylglycine-generating enzyme required for sulfatase activity